MTEAVEEHDDGKRPRQGAQSAHATRRYWSQAKQQSACHQQHDQPLAKLERGHRKPGPAGSQGHHGWVINRKKAGGGFVDNVQREGHA